MNKVVVSAILGGIGNQMFQFAAAKALALQNSAELWLDLRGFDRYPLHNGYELGRVFGVEAEAATTEQLRAGLGLFTSPFALKVFKRRIFSIFRPNWLAVEPTFQYWGGVLKMTLPLYMMGYWQSDRYFAAVAPSIRETFCFRQPLAGLNADLAEEIRSCTSVAIHVRRGDYVSHKKTSQIMSLCSMDYYKRAIDHIEATVSQPHFYLFSDAPDWATTNFAFLDRKTVIAHNKSEKNYIDMQLMSYCKHQIIANSTFSWWGAWLNGYPKKQVVAPARWFITQDASEYLYPESWLVL